MVIDMFIDSSKFKDRFELHISLELQLPVTEL